LFKTDDIGVKAGLDWHESWWYVLRYCHYFPHKPVFLLIIFEMIHVVLVQTFGIHVYDKIWSTYSLVGKRRALIPPSVGYVDENLKPIPEEVSFALEYKCHAIIFLKRKC